MNQISPKMVCKCGSTNLIRRGYRKNKNGIVQRFGCKACGHRFIVEMDGFRKMVYKPETVTLVLDLYFKGLSLRKISDHLNQFHNLNVHYTTVLRWIQKYVQIMKTYVAELKPQVSSWWHADEMTVNVNGAYRWLWNLIDRKTRFLLATQITEARESEDARRLFADAKQKAGKRPETIVTDGLQSYRDGYSKEFYTMKEPRPVHIRLSKFEDKVNQNLIERYNCTVRERNKTMRALDTESSTSTFVDGFQIYYNYIRPHMGLDNKTPAEVAGINLELGKNRWLSLIERSAEHQKLNSATATNGDNSNDNGCH
jgi:putative transposase